MCADSHINRFILAYVHQSIIRRVNESLFVKVLTVNVKVKHISLEDTINGKLILNYINSNCVSTMIYLILLSSMVILMWIKKVRDRHDKLKDFKLPPGPLLFKHLHLLESKTILQNLMGAVKEYGGLLRLEIVYGKDALFITDKDFVGYLLKSTKIMNKNEIYRHTRKWLGNGLLTSDREKWEKQRKMITPAFRVQILEGYVEMFHAAADNLIDRLKSEPTTESIDILPFLKLCALDIICETAMGTKIYAQQNKCPEYVNSIKEECRILMARNQSAYKHFDLLYVFSRDFWKERKTLAILHGFTRTVLGRRKQEKSTTEENVDKKRISFLDLLLSEGSMPDADIAEEVDTFMFAGHDTTAGSTSFALYCLSRHPDVQKKVYEEQKLIFGNNKCLPTYKDLQEMKYLEMVIKECLRLYPPVPFIGRQNDNDFTYGNSIIPKDSSIIIFTYGLHRNPLYFPNPEEFIPERFEGNIEPFTYIPFSAGIRNCIGQRFAMLEVKYLISRILREFEVLAVPDYAVELMPDIVLNSSNGVKIRLKKR